MAGGTVRRIPLKTVLIDLSGTLHVEDTAIEGAQNALRRCVNRLWSRRQRDYMDYIRKEKCTVSPSPEHA